METNESILARQVVAFDSQKKIGAVKDIHIDMDARAVKSFVVTSATTKTSLMLPFEKTVAIGDTFITVKEQSYLLPSDPAGSSKNRVQEYKLIGLEVYSHTGNLLGTVQSYEFDEVYGAITKVSIDPKTFFTAEQFTFFATEMVVVNDGTLTAEDYRKGKGPRKKAAKKPAARRAPAAKKAASAAKPKTTPAKKATATAKAAPAKKTTPAKTTPVKKDEKTVPAKTEAKASTPTKTTPAPKKNDENASLREFLIGAKIVEDVASANGKFSAEAGTTLTEDIVLDAEKNDALVLLTLCVEE